MSAVRILRQQIPFARSILWAPTSASRPGDMPFPVFLRQSALQAIYEHLATLPPPGQGVLGFMLGDRCECPVTGIAYSVIDAALRLNQTIYSDRSRDVITRLWKRLEAQLETQQAHLIGWYHTHAPLPLELTAHDVETHEQYFGEPWQVAMLVGTDPEASAGAFFRAGIADTWVRTPQPFYELLNEDSVRPGGKKRSFMTWKTYRAYNPPAVRPAPQQQVHEPEAQPEPEESAPVESPPAESPPADPSGLDNMPQAELEEPNRTELDEPSVPAQPAPADEPDEEEEAEEWEDPGALKFLSAADDMPPPLSPRPAAFPTPPQPVPVHPPVVFEPEDALPADTGVDAPPEEDAVHDEVPEPSAPPPPPPERRAARRRGSRGRWRKWIRRIAFGFAGLLLLAGGGVAAWQFGPSLLQRLRAFVPSRGAPAPDVPPPAAAPPPRPAPAPRPELAPLDLASDSLARALQAYNGRARLFDKRALDCMVLGRGMVRVERAAASYGVQRNATRATLDADRVERDRELRAGVDSAARQFQRAQCQHP